ncbi:hypothetical protein BDV96DRAFT_686470 [Lophiotrema nucula]|uniref:Sodium:solute symporter family-domain-containing protein n=1 Tax=Lophiotrema nucula TaxID=690887 RepID=A0A6A5Z9B2_9PLEO|nr:hypothetical protein BDV96DRAFT_686470 [Lophiotrema nucula]
MSKRSGAYSTQPGEQYAFTTSITINAGLPPVITAYIVVGGLRSTFICDYLHSAILYTCIFTFMFEIYAVNPDIGSPGKLYDLLKSAQETKPAASADTIRLDQAVGLAAAALQGNDLMDVALSKADVSAGLAGPAAIISLMGSSGAYLFIVLVFMAVTSSVSAESIAASSLMTFDIYKAYINPRTSVKALLWVSIAGLVIYGAALSAISCIFHAAAISLNYLISMLACLLGGGALPMAFIVLWDKTSTFAANVSPIVGLFSGLISWMVATKVRSGTINITTTGDVYNSLTGDCVSLGMGLVCIVLFSYFVPDKKKSVEIIEGEEVSASEEVVDEKKLEAEANITPQGHTPGTHTVLKSSMAETLKPVLEEPVVPVCGFKPRASQIPETSRAHRSDRRHLRLHDHSSLLALRDWLA